jgi:hypothetical protein
VTCDTGYRYRYKRAPSEPEFVTDTATGYFFHRFFLCPPPGPPPSNPWSCYVLQTESCKVSETGSTPHVIMTPRNSTGVRPSCRDKRRQSSSHRAAELHRCISTLQAWPFYATGYFQSFVFDFRKRDISSVCFVQSILPSLRFVPSIQASFAPESFFQGISPFP